MITGQLADRPLPILLHQLYTERFTGELVINASTGLFQIHLRDGYPVHVGLAEGADLLGRVLCEMKVLDEAALRRSLADPPQPGERYGDVLLRLGLCDEPQLKQALRAQVRRKLQRLFLLEDGGFAAVPGAHSRGLQGGESMRVHPLRAIVQGVRGLPPDRLRARLGALLTASFRLPAGTPDEVIDRYGFSSEEAYLASLLRRGFFTLHDLTEVGGYSPATTQTVVYTLFCTDALEMGDDRSLPRAREHITDLPSPPPEPPVLQIPTAVQSAPQAAPAQEAAPELSIPTLDLGATEPLRPPPPSRTSPPRRPGEQVLRLSLESPRPGPEPEPMPEPRSEPRQEAVQPAPAAPVSRPVSVAPAAPVSPAVIEPQARLREEQRPAPRPAPPREPPPPRERPSSPGPTATAPKEQRPAPAPPPARERPSSPAVTAAPPRKTVPPIGGGGGGAPASPPSRPGIPSKRPTPINAPPAARATPAAGMTQSPVQAAPGKIAGRPVSFEEVALMRAEIENKIKVIADETHFAVLGVAEDADDEAIKSAFLQLARKYHPDRIVAMGLQALKENADKIFRRVNEANQVLSDPERRQEYMAELKLKRSSGDAALKEKELAVKAVNAELAFSRGMVFLRRRDYGQAAREFEEALRLNPGEGEHIGYAAWARFCAGTLSAADGIKEMARALKLEPKSGRLHYFIGVLYKQDDNEDKALQSFTKAKELDKRLEEADSEIRLIQARRARGYKSGDSKGKSSESKGGAKDAKDGKDKAEEPKKRSFLDMLRQPIGGKK